MPLRLAPLLGTDREPYLALRFAPGDRTPTGRSLTAAVKDLPGRRWEASRGWWQVTCLGPEPDRTLRMLGFEVDLEDPERGEGLEHVFALADLYQPLCRLSVRNPSLVLVRPRFAGFETTRAILGAGAVWDRDTRRFTVPVGEVLTPSLEPKRDLVLDEATIAAARAARARTTNLTDASQLARAVSLDATDPEAVARVVHQVGRVPGTFGLDLYPFQQAGALAAAAGHGLLADEMGLGKSLTLRTRVPTPNGWTTVGEIRVGDEVFARDGTITTVRALSPVHIKPVLEVHLSDGQVVEASPDHEWRASDVASRRRNCHRRTGVVKDDGTGSLASSLRLRETAAALDPHTLLTVPEMADLAGLEPDRLRSWVSRCSLPASGYRLAEPVYVATEAMGLSADALARSFLDYEQIVTTERMRQSIRHRPDTLEWAIQLPAPVRTPHTDLPLDPYVLGAWLGDGHRGSGEITIDASGASIDGAGGVSDQAHLLDALSAAGFEASRTTRDPHRIGVRGLVPLLRGLGVLHDKHIPPAYLRASFEQRLALLQGLMDTDGSIRPEGLCEFSQTGERLFAGVVELLRSLGIKVTPRSKAAWYRTADGLRKDCHRHHVVTFTTTLPVFRLPRKALRIPATTRPATSRVYVTEIRQRAPEQMRCLLVDHPDHTFLVEGFVPTHNSRQALAALAVHDTKRILLVVPPVVLTHWGREVAASGLARPDQVVVIESRRAEPALPVGEGVVIVSDSLLLARPRLEEGIRAWGPQALVVDEAHRVKTWTSKRSEMVRSLAASVPGPRLAISGTPLFANPAELAPILAVTGHLDSVFGGADAFLTTFCRQDRFRRWVPRVRSLGRLRQLLDAHVWVRRRKEDVARDLPERLDRLALVDVDLGDFRRAHAAVTDTVRDWLSGFVEREGRWPDLGEVQRFARGSIGLLTPLRVAAGLAKVPAAVDWIGDWLQEHPVGADGCWPRPLTVWCHNHDVADRIHAAVEGSLLIDGRTSQQAKDAAVEGFQRGEVPVLLCGIHYAGVGIDLTRSTDVLFVESDWTPGIMQQARDRNHRLTSRPGTVVTYTTLVAVGTLDERIQEVLGAKGVVLGAVLGEGQDVSVVQTEGGLLGPSDIVADLVRQEIGRQPRERTRRAA